VLLALEMYRNIPRCFIRYLRVCCVRTPDLAPLPSTRNWEYIDNDLLTSIEEQSASNKRTQPNREFDEEAYAHAMARQVLSLGVPLWVSSPASSSAVCEAMSDALSC
jgi:hypothetical protein